MIQIIKKAVLSLIALTIVLTAVAAGNTKSTKDSGFDWNPVMDAIIEVESEGNPKAVSGNSVGAMQITPILVKDCNQILRSRRVRSNTQWQTATVYQNRRRCSLLSKSTTTPKTTLKRRFDCGTEVSSTASGQQTSITRKY